MRRRAFLTASTAAIAAGCLRLQSDDDSTDDSGGENTETNATTDSDPSGSTDGDSSESTDSDTSGSEENEPAEEPEEPVRTASLSEEWMNPNLTVWSSPTVLDGVVYVGDRYGSVHAIDLERGVTRWQAGGADGGVMPGIAIDSGTVVAGGATTTDTGGNLYGFTRSTGQQEWEVEIEQEVPTVAALDGVAYASSVGFEGATYGVDMTDGTVIWQEDAVYSRLAVTDDELIGVDSTTVRAHDRNTGEQMWEIRHPNGSVRTNSLGLEAVDGTAYVALDDDGIYAVTGGERLWQSTIPAQELHASTEALYLGEGISDENRTLTRVEASTGEAEWTLQSGESVRGLDSIDDTVYVNTAVEGVFAVDTETGEKRGGTADVPTSGDGGLTASGNRVLIGGSSLAAYTDDSIA